MMKRYIIGVVFSIVLIIGLLSLAIIDLISFDWFKIFITAFLTFILTGVWYNFATKNNRLSLTFVIQGLQKELNFMAFELGYKDARDYYIQNKSVEYADNIDKNINSALEILEADGF